jgi:hypothetical protein
MLTIADTGGQHSTITSLLALRVVSPSLSASREEFDRELRDDAGLRSSIVRNPEGIANLHTGYAASQISSSLKGSTKQFGWLQAPATKTIFPINNFREPCNHPNLYAAARIRENLRLDSSYCLTTGRACRDLGGRVAGTQVTSAKRTSGPE